MKTVEINVAGRPYAAFIEGGLISRIGEELRRILPDRTRYYVITVPKVRKHWGRKLAASMARAGLACQVIEMPDGERHKTMATVSRLAEKLVRQGADRKSVVIALGGGVVGDVAGFLASIYMRGLDVVQVPTTLLAQVDAAIGGKTGVDLPAGKNLLGTFHQPRAVFIDPQVLATLPEREYRSGLFEALKCGIIRRRELFEYMERNRERILKRDAAALEHLIAECVAVKAAVIEADEREGDLRRILNFGHTVGHALEAEGQYRMFRHGEAVAWGMIAAARIGEATGKTHARTAERIVSTVLSYGPLPRVTTRGQRIARRLGSDKKTVNGVVHFVLPVEIGRVEVIADVPERVAVDAVEKLREIGNLRI